MASSLPMSQSRMDGVYCTETHGKNKTSDRWTVLSGVVENADNLLRCISVQSNDDLSPSLSLTDRILTYAAEVKLLTVLSAVARVAGMTTCCL